MVKLEQKKITLTINSTSSAEEFCSKKHALINLLIAANGKADVHTIEEGLLLAQEMMLSPEQVEKIIEP